jgi:hypothetical protein
MSRMISLQIRGHLWRGTHAAEVNVASARRAGRNRSRPAPRGLLTVMKAILRRFVIVS